MKITKVRSVCLVILWIIFSPSFGQLPEFSTTWSKDTVFFKASNPEVVGTDNEGGFYMVKASAKSEIPFVLEHYNNKLHLSNSLDLEKSDKDDKGTVEKILQLKGMLYAIYSSVDKRRKRLSLYARALNDRTLQPDPKKKILCELDLAGHMASNKNKFTFTFSRDSSKIFALRNFSMRGDTRDFHACILFDRELNLLWQKWTEFPYYGEKLETQNIKINKRGDVFILGRQSNVYDLVVLVNNGDSILRFPIRLPGHQVSGAQIELMDDPKLFCAGFYSNSDVQNVRGTFLMSIDPVSKKIKSRNSDEFDLKFILEDQTDNDLQWTMQKGELGESAELYRYTLDKMRIEMNGSIFLIGEQRYRYSNTQMHFTPGFPVARSVRYPAAYADQMSALTNTATSSRNYHYMANDILVVKLDSTGHIQWSRKIHKSQNTIDDDGVYSSFLTGVVKEKLCFLFNDDPRNLNEKWLNRPRDFTGGKSVAVIVSLAGEGEHIRNWIYQTAEREVRMVPKMSKWISNSELILLGQRENFQQIGRVTFK